MSCKVKDTNPKRGHLSIYHLPLHAATYGVCHKGDYPSLSSFSWAYWAQTHDIEPNSRSSMSPMGLLVELGFRGHHVIEHPPFLK